VPSLTHGCRQIQLANKFAWCICAGFAHRVHRMKGQKD
jgi:hypothetical protein